LDASRAALLASIEGLTERDFATALPGGDSILDRLHRLATDERAAIHVARRQLGVAERPGPLGSGAADGKSRVLPPQAIHDLAGARYETTLLLAAAGERLTEVDATLSAIAEREVSAAAEITAARPERPSPP